MKFADIVDLLDLLRDCIISDTYVVPDSMNAALALSEQGAELKSWLIRKEQVPAKEAHLMCCLTIGHDHLYIDVHSTDVDGLVASISDQIRSREVRFPFVYGRALYDAFASNFDDGMERLSNEETIRLLDAVPAGVFQYGRFVVGPSGLQVTPIRRSLRSSARIPAFHCDDPVCRELHAVLLSTGHNASINAERGKLERVLQGKKEAPADWIGLAAEIARVPDSYFGNSWTAPMATLIGDCLGDEELVVLHQGLASKRGTELPTFETREKFLEDLLVGFKDDEIAEVIDSLVLAGQIAVPSGEVRRPVSTEHLRSGAFRLQPQLGANGVRFVSGDPGLATLRERDLFRRIYIEAGDPARHELDWQLRGIDGVSLEVRLDEYLRTVTPAEALTRLVLSGSASAIAASELAGAGEFEGASDQEIISRLLWKLGFEDREPEDLHATFWRLHEKLAATVQSWLGTGAGDADDFKGQASVFFNELEGRLEDALAFAAWALLFDHTSSKRGFSYNPDQDRAVGLELLDRYCRSERAARAGETLRYSGRLTMYPLIRGFGVLATVLQSVQTRSADFIKDERDLPAFANATVLQTFPFRSTIPFLDIAPHSQERLIAGLTQVEQVLTEGNVDKVRNEYSHYRRTSPEVARMAGTLEAVGGAMRTIENLGFGLTLFAPAEQAVDQWGRRVVRFTGPRSLEHAISRPSSLQWAGLPSLRENQYLVRAAAFDDANEVLRFTRSYSSAFSLMWVDYPRPKRAISRLVEETAAPPASSN